MDFSDEPFADLDEFLSQVDARIKERLPAAFTQDSLGTYNVKQGT